MPLAGSPCWGATNIDIAEARFRYEGQTGHAGSMEKIISKAKLPKSRARTCRNCLCYILILVFSSKCSPPNVLLHSSPPFLSLGRAAQFGKRCGEALDAYQSFALLCGNVMDAAYFPGECGLVFKKRNKGKKRLKTFAFCIRDCFMLRRNRIRHTCICTTHVHAHSCE